MVKIYRLSNPRWRTMHILEMVKSLKLSRELSDLLKFGTQLPDRLWKASSWSKPQAEVEICC